MSIRRVSAAVTIATLAVTALATPAAASPLEDPEYVTGFTFDRLWAGVAAILALGALVHGAWLLSRAARRGPEATRRSAPWTVGAAVLALLNGVAVVLTSDAGPGSGNGIVGGYIAIVVGLAAAVLGWLALGRARART